MKVQVICDFDGTISERDMISAIMEAFVPEQSRPIIDRVQAGELSVRTGVEAMFSLIPSHLYDDVVAFARSHTMVREGFPQFIHTCGKLKWKVAVVSGGFNFFVDPVIHNVSTDVHIYRNRIDATGPFLRVEWGLVCDADCEGGCGLCKPSVIRRLCKDDTSVVVIGDGVTDFKAARMADYVFARASLLRMVVEEGIPNAPFETFDDIARAMLDKEAPLYGYI